MTNTDSLLFLTIGEEKISLEQSLGYLQSFGRLRPLIQEIVTDHILFKEIQSRSDLEISSAEFEQAVIEFRMQNNLTNSENFQKWLAQEGMDYAAFQRRVVLGFKLDRLRSKLAENGLEAYFKQQQPFLEQVDLTCLIVKEKELAESFKNKILAGETTLDEITKEYSLMNVSNVKVLRGLSRRQNLSTEIREAIASANIGELVGPVDLLGQWCLFQIQQVIPAVLDTQVKREIENQVLQAWLAEKMSKLPIKLAFNS